MFSPQFPTACFAPPLTEGKLASYRKLIESIGPDQRELKDVLQQLLHCVEVWWELPESKRADVRNWNLRHKGKAIQIAERPLEQEHVEKLWDVTPWMRELDTLSTPEANGILDSLTGELRNAAFHLLWFCKELTLDREPLTQDVLPN